MGWTARSGQRKGQLLEAVGMDVLWVGVLMLGTSGCSGEAERINVGCGGASAWPGTEHSGGFSPGPDDFYLAHTQRIEQTAGPVAELDFDAAGALNPCAPDNWISPIAYRDGRISMQVDVFSTSDPSVPVEYSISWASGSDALGVERLRTTVEVEPGLSMLGQTWPVGSLELLDEGMEVIGPVGDAWDWEHAFRDVRGTLSAPGNAAGQTFSATLLVKLLVWAPR